MTRSKITVEEFVTIVANDMFKNDASQRFYSERDALDSFNESAWRMAETLAIKEPSVSRREVFEALELAGFQIQSIDDEDLEDLADEL